MGALLPIAAIAALLMFAGKLKGVVTKPKPAPAKVAPKLSEAQQAAQLAERQLGKPSASATATTNAKVAQVVPSATLPAGYSSAQASKKAQPTADHLRTRKGKYDRAVLQSFQTSAGLKADGLYGPQTAAALRFFGAKSVPAPLFKGPNVKYAPPQGG
jgi:peptidoglycan hydrolase-like protein with peptidoglycan-binding domain